MSDGHGAPQPGSRKLISIVVPAYNESECIDELARRLGLVFDSEPAYDFEAINVYKQYKRTNSMFANSEFAATGLPGPGELALLEPFRAQLPPEVFGEAWKPPRSDTRTDLPNTKVRNCKT